MSERAEPTVSGELIVRNGKHQGETFPLSLPVTVIGSSEPCDVRITGPGVAGVHCLITMTPAGPTIRSWHPKETLLNGVRTAAAILNHGDELVVGPCRFEIAWYAEELVALTPADEDDLIPLEPAPEPECFELVPVSDEEWDLSRREHVLHEQEIRLAAFLDQRHRKLAELHRQLADGREQLRVDRAGLKQKTTAARNRVKQMKAAIRPLYRSAKEERRKARQLYRRLQSKMTAHQRSVHTEWKRIEAGREGLRVETARQEARFADTRRRLTEAAELLAQNQRRVLADRQEAERHVAQIEKAAEDRVRVAEAQQTAFEAGRERIEARTQDLLHEIERLETRATQSRAAIQELEQQRGRITAELAVSGGSAAPVTHIVHLAGTVPLDRKADRSPDDFLRELALRERELHREQLALAATKTELANRLADLADDRAVLAEQVAALTVAKEQWQSTEIRTLAELEAAAKAVHAWEQSLEVREREAAALDRRRRRQADELWQLRVKLEGWQAALVTFEETAAATRERMEADLTARRDQLCRWEAGLEALCRKWLDARFRDRDALVTEIGRWAAERSKFLAQHAEVDRLRAQLHEAGVKLAAESAAVEQVRTELEAQPGTPGIQATRRLRVLVRKWEKQFAKYSEDFTRRTAVFSGEVAAAEQRLTEVQNAVMELANRRIELVEAEQASEVARFVRERALEEQAIALTAEELRRYRSDVELDLVRGETERLAARVIETGPLPVEIVEPMPTILRLSEYRKVA